MTDPATSTTGIDSAMLVALASVGLVMIGTLWGVARARGQRSFSGFSLLLGAAAASLTLVLPALTFGAVLKPPVMAGLLAAGLLVGLVAGLRPRLGRNGSQVTITGGVWLAVPLAVSIACLQVAGAVQSADGVILAVGALHVTAALVVGSAFILVARRLVVGRVSPVTTAVPAAAVPAVAAPASFGMVAAAPAPALLVAATPSPPPIPASGPTAAAPPAPAAGPRTAAVVITCAACGSPVSVGWRHCVTCGAALAWG